MSSMYFNCPIRGCEADGIATKCNHADIPPGQRVKLLPCPFCEGPPVPISTTQTAGFKWEEDGTFVEAYVFCHECGAESEHVLALVYAPEEVEPLYQQAILLWNTRNGRHRSMYDHGEAEGLNLYPRPDHEKVAP